MPTMGSSNPSARRPHAHNSKHRHHRHGHGSRAHRSVHRQPVSPPLTMVDHSKRSKESLVQNWLQDLRSPNLRPVDEEEHLDEREVRRKRARAQSAHLSQGHWTLHSLQFPEHHCAPDSVLGTRKEKNRHGRYRKPDEDSSIIAPIDGHHQVRNRAGNPSLHRPFEDEGYYERGKKRHKTPSEASSLTSGASPPTDHHFEKKARRKTRDERYSIPKIDGVSKEKKSRKNTGNQSRKKRDNLSSARDVMNNFNSSTILNDRITMQPLLRPGLFDNGRASKIQLPDLTFHEMAFLKQPQREPLKTISRSRENEKRRSERELEEVSAFFLQKNPPESYDTSGRKQTVVSGLSSLEELMGNSSSYNTGTRQHQNASSCGHNGDKDFQKSPKPREGGNSGATTCYTWSASHHSSDHGLAPTGEIPERQHVRSSTPIKIREALARTGVFNNTGIRSVASRQKNGKGSMTCLKDQYSNLKSSQVPGASVVQVEQEAQGQAAYVVRYQDRGTMANEDEVYTGDRSGKPLARCSPTNVQAAKLHAVDQPLKKDSEAAPISMGQATTNQPAQRYEVSLPEDASGDARTPFSEEGNEMGPERPKSPKWAVIERLEAAAENSGPQDADFHTHAEAGRTIQYGQQNDHAPEGCYNTTVYKDDKDVTQNVPFSNHFRPRPNWPYLPEQGQKHDHKLLSGQQPEFSQGLGFHPMPRRLQTPTQYAHSSLHDVGQSAFAYSLVQSPSQCILSNPLAQLYATMHSNDIVGSVPRPQDGVASLTPVGHMKKASDSLARRERKPTPSRREGIMMQGISRQQNMQDYIAQLEQDILGRTQEEDVGEGSPMLQQNEVQNCIVGTLAHVGDFQGLQTCMEDSGLTGRLWDTPPRNQAPSRASLQNWADVRNMQDDEEQRFTSAFWRPNQYHF